jgi:hypothetical protein
MDDMLICSMVSKAQTCSDLSQQGKGTRNHPVHMKDEQSGIQEGSQLSK